MAWHGMAWHIPQIVHWCLNQNYNKSSLCCAFNRDRRDSGSFCTSFCWSAILLYLLLRPWFFTGKKFQHQCSFFLSICAKADSKCIHTCKNYRTFKKGARLNHKSFLLCVQALFTSFLYWLFLLTLCIFAEIESDSFYVFPIRIHHQVY